jgi:tetratricopeptide (TPR) repeat protein
MNRKKSASLSAAASRILRFAIYIIFITYSLYQILHASALSAKITYSILSLAAIIGAIYYEILQYNYEKAIYQLNYECDPYGAKAVYDHLQKIDIAHGFRNRRVIFDVLYHLSLYQTEEAINQILHNDKIFRGSPDQLLIRNVSLFLANVEAGNHSGARRAYPDMIKLKKVKIHGRKLAPLYNWEELEALHYMIENDYHKATLAYRKVNPNYMNNRELTQYYYYYAVCELQCGNRKNAENFITKLKIIAGHLPIKKKAEELLK